MRKGFRKNIKVLELLKMHLLSINRRNKCSFKRTCQEFMYVVANYLLLRILLKMPHHCAMSFKSRLLKHEKFDLKAGLKNFWLQQKGFFLFYLSFFTFSYPWNGRESIVFGSNFRNGVFHGFTRFEVPWIGKPHF